MKRTWIALLALILSLLILLCGCEGTFTWDVDIDDGDGDRRDDPYVDDWPSADSESTAIADGYASVEGIPDYSGTPYYQLNGNVPTFTEEEITTTAYEFYSPLDALGRCGVTEACAGKELMPTEERESISSVKPTGWINNKYDSDLVDGQYIYNRCHLIGFQLTGENANKENLITGTRYMNVEGMLPFENMVADYIRETDNHVMYRVTPIFVGNNLVASGVQMEAWSVEDEGAGICFNIFAYNVQPGIAINYKTGDNWLSGEEIPAEGEEDGTAESGEILEYVLNTNSKKFHLPTCSSVEDMSASNKSEFTGTREELIEDGYEPCGSCKP